MDVKERYPKSDVTRTRLGHGRAGGTVVLRGSPRAISDDSDLSDSDPELSSDDDACSNDSVPDRSSTKKNTREELGEQRLLAYKRASPGVRYSASSQVEVRERYARV